jgi:hypothetical protein
MAKDKEVVACINMKTTLCLYFSDLMMKDGLSHSYNGSSMQTYIRPNDSGINDFIAVGAV